MMIIAIFAGAITGIVLGLFGSGGSIIAMPALMHLLNVEAKKAIAMSMGIGGGRATITGWDNWRRDSPSWTALRRWWCSAKAGRARRAPWSCWRALVFARSRT